MAGEAIRFNASLNTAGFDSGAARLQQVAAATSGKVSASFAAMGMRIAAVIAPFVGLYAAINSVKNALDLGGRLNDLSKTTGETAGNLAILERAFQNAGVGGERMGMAIASMSNFITDFSNGNKAASATMDRLGISMADLAGKTPIEKMRVFMAAIAGIQDPTLRTALAMDVFKKAGKEIVPLASDFSKEVSNAQSELGSLPRILTENAASLDDLGDKLTNSVGNKLAELAVGLAAGATGADNFVAALSKIDAAGLGERIGDALRVAFAAPLEVLQGAGEILIAGALEAGNRLKAAIQYAVDVYYEMMQNRMFYDGLRVFLESMFAKVGEGFVAGIILSMKGLFGLMDWNPLWRPFLDAARGQLDEIQTKVTEAGETASVWMEQGALQMRAAFNAGVKNSEYIYEDSLGAADHYRQAFEHLENARIEADKIKSNSEKAGESLKEGAGHIITASKALNSALSGTRGFDLNGKHGKGKTGNPMLSPNPSEKPDFFTSDNPPPKQETFENRPSGRTRGGPSGSSSDPLTRNARVGKMRGEYLSRGARERASDLYNRGMFNSAVAAEDRANRRSDAALRSAQIKDAAGMFDFHGRKAGNAGEALKALGDKVGLIKLDDKLRQIPGFDPKKSDLDNFKKGLLSPKWLKDQGITPQEKDKEDKQQDIQNQPKGKGPDDNPLANLSTKLDKVITLMTERLPIRVVTT